MLSNPLINDRDQEGANKIYQSPSLRRMQGHDPTLRAYRCHEYVASRLQR